METSIGSMTNLQTKSMKIGDLLVELGLVSSKDLNEALQIGKDTGLPIGRVLIMSAFLTENQFKATLKGQSLLKEGRLQMPALKDAIRQVSLGVSVEEAFTNVGLAKEDAENTVKLGELLCQAGCVTPEELNSALEQNKSTGLPLGKLLQMSGRLSEELLTAALNAQIFVRDGRITKEQAIEGLKGIKRRHVPVEVPLTEKSLYAAPSRPRARLGELLMQSNIISTTDVMNAVEIGLINDKFMGQTLLELDRIDAPMLAYALSLQTQVELGTITVAAAIEALSSAKKNGVPDHIKHAPELIERQGEQAPSLVHFLKQIGRINDDHLTSALRVAIKDNRLIGMLLLQAGVLDKHALQAAHELRELLETQALTFELANKAFQHCVNEQVSAGEALQVISLKCETISSPILSDQQSGPTDNNAASSHTSIPPISDAREGESSALRMNNATQSHPNGAVWEDVRKLGDEAYKAGNWVDAERHWTEAVKLSEPMGESDPRYAHSLERLSEVLLNQKRFDNAEPLLYRAKALKAKILGPEHIRVGATINTLSKLYYFQRKYEQAEPLATQFVSILEKHLGEEHADVACAIHNLATLYHMSSRYEQAEEQYKRALSISRRTLGHKHNATLGLLKSYAALLKSLHREEEAAHLDACVEATITGSWKAMSTDAGQALHVEDKDAS